MPEFPEMENYKALLNRLLTNKQIIKVEITREKSLNTSTAAFTSQVQQQRITKIERRAKMLLFHLENRKILLLHLMLGGFLFFGNTQQKPNRTAQITFVFGDQMQLYFMGLRLGFLHLLTSEQLESRLHGIGTEPFDKAYSSKEFTDLLVQKKGRLKSILTDQAFIAGIGNCYSDEICHHARLHPGIQGHQLDSNQADTLFLSIRSVLTEALNSGGYMETPLFAGDQLTGGFNEKCQVYDRDGLPCFRCGEIIIKTKMSGKKTFLCPRCQREGGQ